MASSDGGSKITDVRVVALRTTGFAGALEPAWNPGGRMAFSTGGGSVVQIHLESGVIGVGPGIDPALLAVVRAYLIGQSIFGVEDHFARLQYYARGLPYQGMAGVDIAIWDAIGKMCGQPLYRLWGGSRTRIPVYASMILLSTPEERAEMASRLAGEGFTAMKLRLHHDTVERDMTTVERVAAAVGGRMAIMVDANQAQSAGTWQPGVRWDFRRASKMAELLEEIGCFWLEEPRPRGNLDELAALNTAFRLPIAGGENDASLSTFRQMIEKNAFDILQPESMVTGGITPLRKIGVLADVFGKQIVPHHGGRGLGTIAHLHLVASWQNAPYLELLHEPPIGDYRHGFSIFAQPPEVGADGCLAVPEKPGLGVEIDPDLLMDPVGS